MHLVHGLGHAEEPAAWPPITLAEAAAVARGFPAAGAIAALTWRSPRPFSAAALISGEAGPLLIKRHHQLVRDAATLQTEHRFALHLAERGVPVPAIMRSAAGASVVTEGEWTYELHAVAAGHDLYRDRPSWTPWLSAGHAHAAGIMLARLHRAAQGFAAPPRDSAPLVASFSIVPARDPLAAAGAYIAARPALARFLADQPWQEQLGAVFAQHHGGLPGLLASQPPLWTHNDWHPSNLTWTDQGEVATVFDFGLATRTCALHDLVTAIERTAIGWLDLAGGTVATDPEAALALIAGYRTLCPLDADALIALLPLVHIEFALAEVDYFSGLLGNQAAAMQAWQGYALDHAQWFAGDQGRAFLATLAQGLAR